MKSCIRIRGVEGAIQGRTWQGTDTLRIGRLESLEIVLDDASVSRRHAEIRPTPRGWRLRDLQSTNHTFLNGTKVATGSDWPLRHRDQIRCGNICLVVDAIEDVKDNQQIPGSQLQVEATASVSWEDALHRIAFDRDRSPRPGEQIVALLRASHHLGHIEEEDELLHRILNDAVGALDAQRGAIVLAQGPENKLKLKALATSGGKRETASRHCFSQNLAQQSFREQKSILCQSVEENPELAVAQSIAEGAMSSVICALLRTPRKQLGILHLDRAPWQKPFTHDDLFLADGLAATVSAGIECAQLLQKQREMFLGMINALAQAVELRDEYTGGHTVRVTNYSLHLGRKLDLSIQDLNLLRMGGPLHDIGKIGIDDAILRKPAKLTDEEFEKMKSHTVLGAAFLENIPGLEATIPIVRSHHERWDGKGYPDGTAGEATPRLARVVAVADAFDAMTSDRPYRKGLDPAVAFAEVEKMSGKQFDPDCAAAFLAVREKILHEMTEGATVPNRSARIATLVA